MIPVTEHRILLHTEVQGCLMRVTLSLILCVCKSKAFWYIISLPITSKGARYSEMWQDRTHFHFFHKMLFSSVIPVLVCLEISMPANQWVTQLLEVNVLEWELLLPLPSAPLNTDLAGLPLTLQQRWESLGFF